jgi:hypothetical protein
MHNMNIGDWVYSCSPGVWRVYRIVAGFHELRYSLDEPKKLSKRVIVFSNRLVDVAWKPAFRSEFCEAALVRPLSAEDRGRVADLLLANPRLRLAFDTYEPRPVPLIVNLAMNVPDRARLQDFCETVLKGEMPDGIPLDRVLQLLTEAGLVERIGKTPFNATLQLVCRDHEVRSNEFILRDWKVLPF